MIAAVKAVGSVIVTLTTSLHKPASVIITEYTPADKPVPVAVP